MLAVGAAAYGATGWPGADIRRGRRVYRLSWTGRGKGDAVPLQLDPGSPWVFAVIAASIAGSAVFPPLPNEGMLATAMSLAAAGRLTLPWVCASAMTGAVLGDLAAYLLRWALSRPGHTRAAGSVRMRNPLSWLHAREHTWGPG